MLLPVRLQWTTSHHQCDALVDSGEEGSFMDQGLARRLVIPIIHITHSIAVNALGAQLLYRRFGSSSLTLLVLQWFWGTPGSYYITLT